jgi:hypothetical protein
MPPGTLSSFIDQADLEKTIRKQPSSYEGECDPQRAGEVLREASDPLSLQLSSENANQADPKTTIRKQPSGYEGECDPQGTGDRLEKVSEISSHFTLQMGWRITIEVILEKGEFKKIQTKRRMDKAEFSQHLSKC